MTHSLSPLPGLSRGAAAVISEGRQPLDNEYVACEAPEGRQSRRNETAKLMII
jgi:hypothetical protein